MPWWGLTLTNRILGFVNAPALMQRAVARLQGAERGHRICTGATATGSSRAWWRPATGATSRKARSTCFPRSPIPDDVAFVRELQKENILAVPGSGFGGPGHFRLAYCCSYETVERSLPGFRRAMERCAPREQGARGPETGAGHPAPPVGDSPRGGAGAWSGLDAPPRRPQPDRPHPGPQPRAGGGVPGDAAAQARRCLGSGRSGSWSCSTGTGRERRKAEGFGGVRGRVRAGRPQRGRRDPAPDPGAQPPDLTVVTSDRQSRHRAGAGRPLVESCEDVLARLDRQREVHGGGEARRGIPAEVEAWLKCWRSGVFHGGEHKM